MNFPASYVSLPEGKLPLFFIALLKPPGAFRLKDSQGLQYWLFK